MKYRENMVCFVLCNQSTRPIYCVSLLGLGMPYVSCPHGLLDAGRYFANASACGLNRLVGTKLFGKGFPVLGSTIALFTWFDWQAADSRVLKSPFNAAC